MRRSEGSYTVEAAFLTPLLLAIVIGVVQICLVMHDRVVVREALEYAVLPATEGKEKDEIYGIDQKTLNECLLISEISEVNLRETFTGYEVFVRMKSGSKESFVREYSAKRKKLYAEEKTILCEIVLDTLHIFE